MSVRIQVDVAGLNRLVTNLSNKQVAKYKMATQMVSDMDQYVPRRTGSLRSSGIPDRSGDYLVWRMSYAHAQYYGTFGKRRGFVSDKQRRFFFANKDLLLSRKGYTTAGTGPYWDKKAKAVKGNDWARVYARALVKGN